MKYILLLITLLLCSCSTTPSSGYIVPEFCEGKDNYDCAFEEN